MATAISDSNDRRKLALIIGNGNYSHQENKLSNPVNNARDLAGVLKTIGFRVTTCCDYTKKDMNNSIIDFARTINDGDLVLFYYSGHGSQVNNHNYLIPTNDATVENETDFEDFAISYDRTFKRLTSINPSYTTIFILDCDNQYVRKTAAASTSN